jgi:hypothetical protein
LSNQKLHHALKKNNDRQEKKEKSYDMEIKFGELQDIMDMQPINKQAFISRV